MLLSLNWLKDFVKIPNKLSPEKIGEILTMHSVEVESVKKMSDSFNNIVVGEVLEIKKHPNADKLQLVKVNVKDDILDIVCGAPNIEVGQKVPVALVGAILPNEMEIKEAEVRGRKSCGMLCAEDELGLGIDHNGILILDKSAKIGQNLGEYLKLDDAVLEVENKTLSNRPDLWGHYGIARELGALLDCDTTNKFKNIAENKINIENKSIKFNVSVKDSEICPRYMAVALTGIKIEDSSKCIQERLRAVGQRPINNIVDITNYVMLELGQPIHAFDASSVKDIIVRKAKKNEKIITLDNNERELDSNMLVIADKERAVAIAGVMGGANSEISDNTDSVIIEVANFNAVSVRKTAQKLGLRTEASKRYEKSLDPSLCEVAIARVVELIKETSSEVKVASELIDVKDFKLFTGPLTISLEWLNKNIGLEIENKRMVSILEKLGFNVVVKKDIIDVTIPTWRATKDVSIAEDIVEEVARVCGYNKIPSQFPKVELVAPKVSKKKVLERKIKNILSTGAKLTEVYNYSFNGEAQLKKINIDFNSYIKLANPIVNQHTLLRQSLVPNILDNIKLNQAKFEEIKIFEIGSVFLNIPGEIVKDNSSKEKLPLEEKIIGIAIASKEDGVLSECKGAVELLAKYFKVKIIYKESKEKLSWANLSKVAKIFTEDGSEIGMIAELSEKVAGNIGIKKKVAIAEINFNKFFNVVSSKYGQYNEIPKFPSVVRDLAFVVNSEICYNDIKQNIKSFSDLIRSVELFDVYEGGKLGKGKKNMAFHVEYLSLDKTLTAEEVDKLQNDLVEKLEKKFKIKNRDW